MNPLRGVSFAAILGMLISLTPALAGALFAIRPGERLLSYMRPLSLAGVFGGFIDKIPMGAAFNKGLTFRMGQTHVHRYLRPLLGRIERGEIDPSFVITHRVSLDDAPDAYKMFRDKEDNCVKFVMYPK